MQSKAAQYGDLLTIGFGAAVAMWAAGYVARKPTIMLPGWVLFGLLIACLVAAGLAAGRYSRRGWKAGLYAGLLCAALNLLVMGSLVGGDNPNQIVPSALIWIPGSFLFCAGLMAASAYAGRVWPGEYGKPVNWATGFARVAAAATFLLLVAGGFVTSHEAGLAVTDWPNSYGYNMFLFPLSRMTGGIYYEHAHRLLGSLVGLTTVALAVYLQFTEKRQWLRRLGWIAVLLVIAQGILGGLRVTGYFTLSQSPDEVAPNIYLAIAHGVMGQLFFCLTIAIAAFTSTAWLRAEAKPAPFARADRTLTALLAGLLFVQLVLGAVLRHVSGMLMVHISMAVVVFFAAVIAGTRLWGLNPDKPLLSRLGGGLIAAVVVQFSLGFVALYAVMATAQAGEPAAVDVIGATLHQTFGAALYAVAVAAMLWTHRLLVPTPAAR